MFQKFIHRAFDSLFNKFNNAFKREITNVHKDHFELLTRFIKTSFNTIFIMSNEIQRYLY